MKKAIKYLNGMKSRCFMLLTCLILLVGVTSCSSDEFETNLPDDPKQLSKAELKELALSLMPQTRAASPYPVMMATIHPSISIRCLASDTVIIHWGDHTTIPVPEGSYSNYTHTYTDNKPVHVIFLEASNEAIRDLNVYSCGLIFLDVAGNTNLRSLTCTRNELDSLDLTGCPNLEFLWASVNLLSSVDLTHVPHLLSLLLADNQFTEIDVSKNIDLEVFDIGYNQITDLDLTNNTALWHIDISNLPIRTINNSLINAKSFAVFPELQVLWIQNTPFTSLDLSANPLVRELNISGTAITQLDILNLQIERFEARNSQLTNFKYTLDNLKPDCYYIDIIGTPFEKNPTKVSFLASSVPDRSKPDQFQRILQGQLYTTSETIKDFLDPLTGKNWVVYSE